MCLVISTFFITFGPNASGVTSSFPKPTISTSSLNSIFSPISLFNSSAKIFDASSSSSSVNKFIFFISIVIYSPFGFPIACSPCSLVIFTLVIFIFSFTSSCWLSIPSTSFSTLFAFLYKSLLSSAKSVLIWKMSVFIRKI